MVRSRGNIKKELVTEIFISFASGKKDTLNSFGRAACCLCFSAPCTCALRESGDMAVHRQMYRCAMYWWSWLAASQLWPWNCEKAFGLPVPVLMNPAKKWGIWSGALTSRVEQGWVQTSRSPGKDSYSACLHHLERCIHLYLLCTQLLSEWK